MKASGLGIRHGEHGILKYTEAKTIPIEHLLSVGAPSWLDPGRYADHDRLSPRVVLPARCQVAAAVRAALRLVVAKRAVDET